MEQTSVIFQEVMAGAALPQNLAIATVLNVEKNWRPTETVVKGGTTRTVQRIQADSFGNTNINFQGIIPPNDQICIDRIMTLHYFVTVEIKGIPQYMRDALYVDPDAGHAPDTMQSAANTNIPLPSPLFLRGRFLTQLPAAMNDPDNIGTIWPCSYTPGLALRPLPLQKATSSMSLTINGTSTTVSPIDWATIWPYLEWLDESNGSMSTVPFYPSEGPMYQPRATGIIPMIQWGRTPFEADAENVLVPSALAGSNRYAMQPLPFGVNETYFSQSSNLWQTGSSVLSWELLDCVEVEGENNPATQWNSSQTYNVVLRTEVFEPLVISPLRFGKTWFETGLTRINNMSLVMNLSPQLARMFACSCDLTAAWANGSLEAQHVPTGREIEHYGALYSIRPSLEGLTTAAGLVIPAPQRPELLLTYNTPDPITAARMPAFCVYKHEQITPYITSNVLTTDISPAAIATAPGPTQVVLQSIRLPVIPSKLIIFARPSKNQTLANVGASVTPAAYHDEGKPANPNTVTYDPNILLAKLSDHFLRITSVNITFIDRIGLMTTYTEADLYKTALKNGYKGSFDKWKGGWGSILVLDVAEDLCLDAKQAAGQSTYTQLQITMTVQASSLYRGIQQREGNEAVGPRAGTLGPYVGDCCAHNLEPGQAYGGAGPICPWYQITYDAYVLCITPAKAIIGAGQCTFVAEGATEAQVIALLSAQKKRSDTSGVSDSLTGGSLDARETLADGPSSNGNDDDLTSADEGSGMKRRR